MGFPVVVEVGAKWRVVAAAEYRLSHRLSAFSEWMGGWESGWGGRGLGYEGLVFYYPSPLLVRRVKCERVFRASLVHLFAFFPERVAVPAVAWMWPTAVSAEVVLP